MPVSNSAEPDYYSYIKANEGVRHEPYFDSKGNATVGVGHFIKEGEKFPKKLTDEKVRSLFDADLANSIAIVKKDIGVKHWGILPAEVKVVLADLAFRTDWQLSPDARKDFKAKKYYAFAEELLDSDEYRLSKKEGTGIAPRMERNALAVVDYGNALQEGWDFPTAVEERVRMPKEQSEK